MAPPKITVHPIPGRSGAYSDAPGWKFEALIPFDTTGFVVVAPTEDGDHPAVAHLIRSLGALTDPDAHLVSLTCRVSPATWADEGFRDQQRRLMVRGMMDQLAAEEKLPVTPPTVTWLRSGPAGPPPQHWPPDRDGLGELPELRPGDELAAGELALLWVECLAVSWS